METPRTRLDRKQLGSRVRGFANNNTRVGEPTNTLCLRAIRRDVLVSSVDVNLLRLYRNSSRTSSFCGCSF
jgi:hypothetical protein